MTLSSTNEGRVFKAEDFSKKSMQNLTFTECSFHNCNFSESLLHNAKFCTCTFYDCNLSLVKLDGCRIQEVTFVDCKIVGAEFFKCEKRFFSATYNNCLLNFCNFSDLNMKNCQFKGSKIIECYFTNTCLSGADFSHTDLTGTTFHNCDLSRANFSKATQYAIDPQTNKINKAQFSLPEAVGLLRTFDIKLL